MSPDSNMSVDQFSQTPLFAKISDICNTVNIVVDEKELLETSLSKTLSLFGAARGSIFILDEESNKLMLKACVGLPKENKNSIESSLGEGVVGRVAELKQPIVVDDISQDDRFSSFKARGSYKTPSFICAPLLVKDKFIGVINITDKETGHTFKNEEMQLLDFLTTQIALNYRRIELYHKFKSIVKEAKNLKDKLGESDEEAKHLKRQIVIQEKLATIGKLAGGIAHEFNNPLDGVMRYTNLCLDQLKDDDIIRGYLLEVKQGLNRMANIVRNLLACSREDHPQQEPVNIKSLIDHALHSRQSDLHSKNIELVVNVPDDIGKVNDLGLERIILNLAQNAIDAIGQDGKITIEAQREGDLLVLKVADTGSGIEQEDINKIFEPFFTTKDIDKGCGLGLTIIGEIIKAYNGSINVESEKGQGTTFIISLPT